MLDRSGQQLGNYRLMRLLGQGGFADVYLGQHIHLETLAAIKVLRIQMGNHDLESFRREAKTIAHLVHPNIVRVLDFGVEQNTPFLVMDYAPNGSLRQLYPRGTRLPLSTIVSYIKQIAGALQYAHDQRLIHRDVKPENIILGTNNQILLSDFGIAAVQQSTSLQATAERTGTAPYMAPEQILGKPRQASDQYALAVIVYEWLSGSLPFSGGFLEIFYQHVHVPPPPLREKMPTVPPAIEEVVMTALSKEPSQRFASVEAFARAFEQASEEGRADVNIPQMPAQPASPSFFTPPAHIPVPPISASSFEQPVAIKTPSSYPSNQPPFAQYSSTPTKGAEPTLPSPPPPAFPPQQYGGSASTPPPTSGGERAVAGMPGRKAVSQRKIALSIGLALLIVLLVGLGIYYPIANNINNANMQATATAEAPLIATANAHATATAAVNDYNNATGKGVEFGFNEQHTHFNPFEITLNTSNVSGLKQEWTALLSSQSTAYTLVSSPTVTNGVIYIGSWDNNLYAFKASGCGQSTCSPLWTAATLKPIVSSPAVANGVVYVGSYDNNLYAFNASGCGQSTCSPLWTGSTGGSIITAPTVANGIVYVGSYDKELYAFKASGCGQSSCSPLWTASTGSDILSSPAVANGVVYVGSFDNKFYAFNASGCGQSTCSPLWTATTGGVIFSSPAIANGVVYVGSGDNLLYAFTASGCGQSTCSPLWTASTGKSIDSSPAVANGSVFIGSDDDKLYAFRASGCGQSSCSPLWTASTGSGVVSSPTIANGIVFVGSSDHNLYAFNASGCGQLTCSPLVTVPTGNGIHSSPAVANGVVYVASFDGKLYAFHLPGTG